MDWMIRPASAGLKGILTVPPDKSISHRAVLFGSVCDGKLTARNFLFAEDCMRTLEAFRAMGVEIQGRDNSITIHGKGLNGLAAPSGPLYAGNSGTTMRIIAGILAGQPFETVLTGDESLSKRPMRRIMEPLLQMGAGIEASGGGDRPPLKIKGSGLPLNPIDYRTPVASAQVKSCVLAAGLYARGRTSVTEPFQSRDHTERMLEYFSADINRTGLKTEVGGMKELEPKDLDIPGDISSAAFFIIGALIVKGSKLIIRDVGLNPTRSGILEVLKRMGADISVLDRRESVEPRGDLAIKYSELKGTTIEKNEVPLLIDEIPSIAVAAATAEGETVIKGIEELRVKETDRVKSIKENLSGMGVDLKDEHGTLIISGGVKKFKTAKLESFGDHRTAMSAAVAALVSGGECLIRDTECVKTSYPGFIEDLHRLIS